MYYSLSKPRQNLLSSIVLRYGWHVKFLHCDFSLIRNFPIKESDHISLSAYLRLFCAEFLPSNLNKILYLDCDTIVNSNISEFYSTDISDYALAAILDEDYFSTEKQTRLNLKRSTYINSGVLLINLKRWREDNFSQQVFDFIKQTKLDLLLHDQDVLNVLLEDAIKLVDIKYNFQSGFILRKRYELFSEKFKKGIKSISSTPSIIHYTWIVKPWNKPATHPYAYLFDKYVKLSGIDKKIIYHHRRIPLKQRLYYFLVYIGIWKNRRTYIIGRY